MRKVFEAATGKGAQSRVFLLDPDNEGCKFEA
jgi:hypothetical protein